MLYHPVTIGGVVLPGNLFLAPVAGYSDRAFRSVCREGGADFAYTEMVSSEALVRGSDKTALLMARAPNETQYAIQLFGGEPAVMAAAVRLILNGASAERGDAGTFGSADACGDAAERSFSARRFDVPEVIDINAGCPVPKITKTGAGSALTRDPDRLYKITEAAVRASAECAAAAKNIAADNAAAAKNGDEVKSLDAEAKNGAEAKISDAEVTIAGPVPITVKIRAGWDADHITWKEAACAAIEAGASAITLHGRTRAQGYEGAADWDALAELTALVAGETGGKVPVFGSGDVFSPEAAARMLEQTGCAGVMFARGAMGNPFIFIQTRRLLQTGSYEEIPVSVRMEAGLRELRCLIEDAGEESACRQMRKRFCAYSKGVAGGAALRAGIVTAETERDYVALFRAAGVL